MVQSSKKVIFIVGPTSAGKTDLAVKLARYFGGEIISADSRQVYEGLDLGTGKEGVPRNFKFQISNFKFLEGRIIFLKERARYIGEVPQYLIDIVKPGVPPVRPPGREGGEMYNLALFLGDAKLILNDIWQRGRMPIVTGGTGLYISALIKGYDLPKTKQGRGEWRRHRRPNFQSLVIGIKTDRLKLHRRIDLRLKKRIELGLIREVKKLLSSGVPADWLIKLGLEYRFTTWFVQGKFASKSEYFDKLKHAIHAYARRQMTWLRHQIPGVEWVSSSAEAANYIVRFLK